jgi:prophage regulatory protein
LLRFPDVSALVGLRKTAIFYRIKAGTFPKPVPIGARAIAWREHEVAAWILDRDNQSRDDSAAPARAQRAANIEARKQETTATGSRPGNNPAGSAEMHAPRHDGHDPAH